MQVDSTNFSIIYPKISEEIKNCTFIALDLEFSGLAFNSNCMPTLFDSLEDRYKKLRTNVSHFIPLQLGLSVYTKHALKNEYTAHTYSFSCCPRSSGPETTSFTMEVSAIEFLADNTFDFNRFARLGIPFLNRSKEKMFRNYIADRSKIYINHSMMDKLLELRVIIGGWMAKLPSRGGRKHGQCNFSYKSLVNPLHNYLIIDRLRNEFKSFWVVLQTDNISVYSVSPVERKQLLAKTKSEEGELINSFIGLSRIIQDLVNSKKPIIGNNMMIDLVMLYQHFIDTLPVNLQTFKDELLKNFNTIYDIKSIISNIRKHFPAYEDDMSGRNLSELYGKLSRPDFIRASPYQPIVIRDDDSKCEIVNRCHDAGSDAFATGYVFLRVCAIIAISNAEETIIEPSPKWETFISPLDCFKNKINLIRAAFHYMDLEAKSQRAARPEWLVLRCRDPSNTLSIVQVYGMFATQNTTVDFRPINDSAVMLAIGNFKVAREIIEKFRKNKHYKITKYNMIKDSRYGRAFAWTTAIVGVGATGYLVFKLFNSRA